MHYWYFSYSIESLFLHRDAKPPLQFSIHVFWRLYITRKYPWYNLSLESMGFKRKICHKRIYIRSNFELGSVWIELPFSFMLQGSNLICFIWFFVVQYYIFLKILPTKYLYNYNEKTTKILISTSRKICLIPYLLIMDTFYQNRCLGLCRYFDKKGIFEKFIHSIYKNSE